MRTSGSHEPVSPLHYDPVGPWGETAHLHPFLPHLSCCHFSLVSSLACARVSFSCIFKHSCCTWKCCPRQRASQMNVPTCPAHVAAGVTPGPGRGPSGFERMQRRHRGALAFALAWHQPAICPPALAQRAFTKRVEVCMPPWSILLKAVQSSGSLKYSFVACGLSPLPGTSLQPAHLPSSCGQSPSAWISAPLQYLVGNACSRCI